MKLENAFRTLEERHNRWTFEKHSNNLPRTQKNQKEKTETEKNDNKLKNKMLIETEWMHAWKKKIKKLKSKTKSILCIFRIKNKTLYQPNRASV